MSTHVGRSWTGTFIENACPCPKEPCGLVDTAKVDPKCDQHTALKSMRQGHPSDRCPAVTTDWTPDSSSAAQRWRETPARTVGICGAKPDGPTWLICDLPAGHAGWHGADQLAEHPLGVASRCSWTEREAAPTEYEREAVEVAAGVEHGEVVPLREGVCCPSDVGMDMAWVHIACPTVIAELERYRKQIEDLTRERDEARAEITEIKNNRLVSAIFGHRKGAPKPFCLYRRQDVSGVSGTGVVAVGCEFPDGLVVLRWTSAWPTSVVFHERGIESVKAIHGHDGRTEVVWLSDEFESLAEMEQRLELVEAHRDSLLVLETAAREELVALRAFFDVWHNRIATYDPGDVLTVDGVRVHNIASLLTVDDSRMLDDFADRVLATQAAVDSLPPKPDTPEDDRG